VNDGITPLCSQGNCFRITNIGKDFTRILVPQECCGPALQTHHFITTPYKFAGDTAEQQTASTRY
jgi:hypothetical protein